MGSREALLVVLGGLLAGGANAIAGGGSLLIFPLLVALGLPPLDANVTNSIGITPAALGGAIGYRAELRGQATRFLLLLPVCAAGAMLGAVLLLVAPAHTFTRVVPGLIAVSCMVLLFQRRIGEWLSRRRANRRGTLVAALLVTGVYGGYFGAAVSIMVLAVLGVTVDDTLQRLNAIKVALAGVMNVVASVAFMVLAPVHWWFVLLLAPATLVGGRVGAAYGRHIPDAPLRVAVVVLGLAGAVWLQVSR